MEIQLKERTQETVAIYFEKAQNPKIKKSLPQKAQSLEEAVNDYKKTLLPGATSYGKTIWVDEIYVGDIWCYCIDLEEEPNAMLSYCIFEESFWNKGIATSAVGIFLQEILIKYQLTSIGAFTYASNIPSIRVLEKNQFLTRKEFIEDGLASVYLQYDKQWI